MINSKLLMGLALIWIVSWIAVNAADSMYVDASQVEALDSLQNMQQVDNPPSGIWGVPMAGVRFFERVWQLGSWDYPSLNNDAGEKLRLVLSAISIMLTAEILGFMGSMVSGILTRP